MAINERMYQFRLATGHKQKDFAPKIFMSPSHLAGIENGDKEVTNRTIFLTGVVFGANEVWLRTGKGEMFATDKNAVNIDMMNLFNSLKPSFKSFVYKQLQALTELQQSIK